MKWLSWLIGDDNKEAETVRENTRRIGKTLGEIDEKLRLSAGLPNVQAKIKLIGGKK